jgi:hypothetical protein
MHYTSTKLLLKTKQKDVLDLRSSPQLLQIESWLSEEADTIGSSGLRDSRHSPGKMKKCTEKE